MAIFGPKPLVNPLRKMSFSRLFKLPEQWVNTIGLMSIFRLLEPVVFKA